jgi:hypothetical protein
MKPFRRTILIMPFFIPEALPARTPYSKVVIIPPPSFTSHSKAGLHPGRLLQAGQGAVV